MVIQCDSSFYTNNDVISEYANLFPFELSNFQKYALEGIIHQQHVLITAHTGSGKTLPAEFAIHYFVNKGKKVIYTSPIKALSNQKFREFKKKFPSISFGILTGDIKFNPEADVLIMTTEILRNKLFQLQNSSEQVINSQISFNMDIQNELACVIFDEIHYFNDPDRGKIWEESIMMLPNHISMVMLSATIDKPLLFAEWIEKIQNKSKEVYLIPTNFRIVPLKHYAYITVQQANLKKLKESEQNEINEIINKPILIKDNSQNFDNNEYNKIKKIKKFINDKLISVPRHFVLNQLVKYLYNEDLLPGICFIFSRKNVEYWAQEMELRLFEPESKLPVIVRSRCEKIIMKLPNYKEYLQLPEFEQIVNLLQKGIAIHHSGIIPIFREMIELLFEEGFIKLLFATETFAVGINLPTRSVIFTGFQKYNGQTMRYLFPHEYTQMAGRAGRRGIDTLGTIFHCNNLVDFESYEEYKKIINGGSQTLESKFKINYNLVLSLYKQYNIEFEKYFDFISKSFINNTINSNVKNIEKIMEKQYEELDKNKENDIYKLVFENENNKNRMENIRIINKTLEFANNKNKKTIEKQLELLMKEYNEDIKISKEHFDFYNKINFLKDEIQRKREEIYEIQNNLKEQITIIVEMLGYYGYIDNNKLTDKGYFALEIQEVHCLAFVDLLEYTNYFEKLGVDDIVSIFGCFSNITVKDDYKEVKPKSMNEYVNDGLCYYENCLLEYESNESKYNLNTGISNDFHYDIINECVKWCNIKNEIESRELLEEMQNKKEIFTGEFIKSILKINNISNELMVVCEKMNKLDLLKKCKLIGERTLKFIVTNQSLYI